MKRTSIIIASALFSLMTWAQPEKGTWSIQPKLGLNMATMTSYRFKQKEEEGSGHVSPRCNVLFAIEAERQITRRFGIAAGVQYSMQGERESLDANGERVKATDKLDYINVPILTKFYVAKNLALKVGLQPSFNIKHDYELDSSADISYWSGLTYYHMAKEGNLSDIGIDIKAFDLAIPIGIAYEFDRGTKNCLVAEARWNCGLLKVANLKNGDHPRNMVFQLTLGYKFNL